MPRSSAKKPGDAAPRSSKSSHSPWQVYARFLQLQREVRAKAGVPEMDAMEERVFEALAACWGQGRPVTVLQAMSMTGEASPTTVHRRLKSLRKKELIRLHEDEADNRIKYIHATDAGMAYLDQMGRCLHSAGTPS